MKRLAIGALLFSATSAVLGIDKSNYRQNLCDDSLLSSNERPVLDNSPELGKRQVISRITNNYNLYCNQKANYEEALAHLSTHEDSSKKYPCTSTSCAGTIVSTTSYESREACVERTGILFAQTCQYLKDDKKRKGDLWNQAMHAKVACSNR